MKVKNKKPLKLVLVIVALMLLAFSYLSFVNSKKGNNVVIKNSSTNSEIIKEESMDNNIDSNNNSQTTKQETEREDSENQLPQTQQIVFSTQEECEQKTDKSCSFQMCDYVPPGKNFEEVCGKDFKKGWVPISVSSSTLAKSQIIDYIDKNINSLAPASPHAGVWNVNRYWFTSNNDVYVEYASDGELKQMLVSVDTGNENTAYTRKAAFKAGESSWILIEGEDTQFGKTRELYEKAGDKWVKKN